MASGGITFGIAKASLRLVTDNGQPDSDPRVMRRANEAIQELLSARTEDGRVVIPVNSMATYDVVFTGERALLPKELENAISAEIVSGSQNGQNDVVRGWHSLVNNFAYLDPEMSHDNPLVDEFLQPDPADETVLRRQYRYPGIADGTMVRVTGRKRFLPITSDDDFLIIQNIPAVKMMVQSIERREARNAITEAREYKAEAVRILVDEASAHLLDPQNLLARKFDYQKDAVTYAQGTFGWARARLALELPGLLSIGKSEVGYFLNEAVREAVAHYNFLGRTERYSADEGPNQLTFANATVASDVLAYSDFEVLRLLVVSQRVPPTGVQPPQDANATKAEAFQLIERDLAATVEASRTAAHLAASKTSIYGSRGWVVARIGLEVPEALMYPVKRLGALIDRAEERGMSMGIYRGMIEEFDAKVVRGHVLMPARVESMLVATLNGRPAEIRSIYFRYLKNGPGDFDYSCNGRIQDEGEVVLKDGQRRRRYFVHAHGISVAATPTTTTGGGGTIPGLIDGVFYIASDSRIVALPEGGGVALEIFDGTTWVRQSTWTE